VIGAMVDVVAVVGRRRVRAAYPPGVLCLLRFAAGPLLASPLPFVVRLFALVALFEFEVIVMFSCITTEKTYRKSKPCFPVLLKRRLIERVNPVKLSVDIIVVFSCITTEKAYRKSKSS
jgi:hypothetical protein